MMHSNNIKNPLFIIVHGTRGFNEMEIIDELSSKLYNEGFNVLSINLSYGIDKRRGSFLPCALEHSHNEHESVKEIVLWYDHVKSIGYNKVQMIGHSRGAFNIVQAASIINDEKLKTYLLAPMIDTLAGTRNYYQFELNLPYDEIIKNTDNYLLSSRYKKINFLFCENVDVYSETFRTYLDFSKNESMFPFTFNVIELLERLKGESTVFYGTDDEIILDSYKKLYQIRNQQVRIVEIEGSDHFFRDIYLDDVVDVIISTVITEQ